MSKQSSAHRAKPLFVAALAVAFAHASAADDPDSTVVVTAARSAQRLSDALPHTTVLTRDDIDASQAVDVVRLLAGEAGVQFASNGGRGTATSLFVRGGSNLQTLVLVDGVPLSRQDTTGQVGLEHLMLDQVERIEIVRGNVSALYGAGAVGGVIQIFTRSASASPSASLRLEAGSRGLVHGSAQGSVALGNATALSIGLSSARDTGFSALDPKVYPHANPDRDGYANTSASLKLRQTLAPEQVLSLGWVHSDGRLDYDDGSSFSSPLDVHRSRTVKDLTSLRADNRIGAAWTSQLTLSRQTDDALYTVTGPSEFRGHYVTQVDSVNWVHRIDLSSALGLTLGLDHQRQSIAADDNFGGALNVQRKLWAAFGGLAWRVGAHDLSLQLRHDVVAGKTAPTSANLAWGYSVAPGVKLMASLANAFSVPPLGYLFDPFSGNPDLKPERAHSAEVGAQWTGPGQRLRATLFRTRVAQELDFDNTSFRFENLASTRNSGLELSWDGKLSGATDLRASLTAQNPVDAGSGERRLRRSRTLAGLSASHALGQNLRAGLALRYAGDRLDGGGVVLPAYTLADITAQWDWQPTLQVFGRIENLGDSHYQTAKGYNATPRGVFVGLRWTPAGR